MDVRCHWFDYTGAIVGFVVLGLVSLVLGVLLFKTLSRVSKLEGMAMRPAAAAGGDAADSSLLGEPVVHEGMSYQQKIQAQKAAKEAQEAAGMPL